MVFYKDLLLYFDYKIIDESEEHIGASNGTTDFWVIQTAKPHPDRKFHRKAIGINHIAFRVYAKEDVDKFTNEFLKIRKVKPLYNSPKYFPEYREGYYAVFFEDPDRIKIEVVYVPSEKNK